MRLNFNILKSITQGAASVTGEDCRISFSRFSEKEIALYQRTVFANKIPASAGVQMVFRTDGDALSLKVRTSPASSRNFFMVDIFANDSLIGVLGNVSTDEKNIFQNFELGEFEGKYILGSGEKTVRIVYPWSVKTDVVDLSIEHASFVSPVKRNKRMIAYGDSITHGYDALHPSNAYAVKLAHALDAELLNKAMGGEVFFPPLAAIKADFMPDYVTVAYGTNDWGTFSAEDFEKNADEFFARLSANYPCARIFAILPIWREDCEKVYKVGRFGDLAKIIQCVTVKYHPIICIPGIDLVPHDTSFFSDGYLHPNDAGFLYYAEHLECEIKKYL